MSNAEKVSDEGSSITEKLQVDDKDNFFNEDSEQPVKQRKYKSPSNNHRTTRKTQRRNRRDPNEVRTNKNKEKEANILQEILKRQANEINKITEMLKRYRKALET